MITSLTIEQTFLVNYFPANSGRIDTYNLKIEYQSNSDFESVGYVTGILLKIEKVLI